MGFEDRDYYREEESRGFSFNPSSSRSVVSVLLIINIGIFLIDWLTTKQVQTPRGIVHVSQLGEWFALSNLTLTRPWLWYQYLTYGFLHDTKTIWHILGNMFVLYMFGRHIETRYGSREFLRFYIIAILFGGLVYSLGCLVFNGFTPVLTSTVIGASGAVVAVLILFIFNYPKTKVLLMGIIPMPAWVLGVFIVVSDLLGSLNERSETAHTVHLAGIALGIAYFYLGWNFTRLIPGDLSTLKSWFKSKPKLKVHSPDEVDSYSVADEQGDALLDKVKEHGIDSLTKKERKQLEAYSRRMSQKHR